MIRINPNVDEYYIRELKDALVSSNGYCPCVLPSLRNEDHKCMCKEFREMEEGVCHCELYEKIKD